MSGLVVINVSGTKFQVDKNVFARIKGSMKNVLEENENLEIYIGRSAACFESILYYLQNGELHIPPSVCPGVFLSELEFWKIDVKEIERCCNQRYAVFMSDQVDLLHFEEHSKSWSKDQLLNEKEDAIGKCGTLKLWMQRTIHDPRSSLWGKLYLAVLTVFVVASIFVMCYTSMDVAYYELEISEVKEMFYGYDDYYNYVDIVQSSSDQPSVHALRVKRRFVLISEYVIAGFFTIDFFVRLLLCTSIKRFCLSFLNIVDFLSVLCAYIKIFVKETVLTQQLQHSGIDYIDILNIARVLRLFRILCLHNDFVILVYSLKVSLKHFCLLLILLFSTIIFFSSLIFFFEDRKTITNIPFAFWWAIVTMTTVGYGDIVPVTVMGKVVGALCSLTGVVVLALTLPVFVNNFTMFSNFAKANSKSLEAGKCSIVKGRSNKIRDVPESKPIGHTLCIKKAPKTS